MPLDPSHFHFSVLASVEIHNHCFLLGTDMHNFICQCIKFVGIFSPFTFFSFFPKQSHFDRISFYHQKHSVRSRANFVWIKCIKFWQLTCARCFPSIFYFILFFKQFPVYCSKILTIIYLHCCGLMLFPIHSIYQQILFLFFYFQFISVEF